MATEVDSLNTIPETFWAYLAGFVDGDGSIYLSKSGQKNKRNYTRLFKAEIKLINTSRLPLDIVAYRLGGSITKRPPYATGFNKRPFYEWTVIPTKKTLVLAKMIPYLIIKREVAQIALDFLNWKQRVRATKTGKKPFTEDEFNVMKEYYERARTANDATRHSKKI